MTPVRLALPGRTLLLVAGMPGAGKSTLLARLPARPDVVVLDSDAQRAALRPVFGAVPYRRYRPLVHAWHRLTVLVAAFSATPTVVVHLPATSARTRAAVALLARLTGRAAYLLWLHVDPADARTGQRDRGRVVGVASFAGHAGRALATTDALRHGPPPGFADVTVLDRRSAAGGLRLVTDEAPLLRPSRAA
jgi:predicted kinase